MEVAAWRWRASTDTSLACIDHKAAKRSTELTPKSATKGSSSCSSSSSCSNEAGKLLQPEERWELTCDGIRLRNGFAPSLRPRKTRSNAQPAWMLRWPKDLPLWIAFEAEPATASNRSSTPQKCK